MVNRILAALTRLVERCYRMIPACFSQNGGVLATFIGALFAFSQPSPAFTCGKPRPLGHGEDRRCDGHARSKINFDRRRLWLLPFFPISRPFSASPSSHWSRVHPQRRINPTRF